MISFLTRLIVTSNWSNPSWHWLIDPRPPRLCCVHRWLKRGWDDAATRGGRRMKFCSSLRWRVSLVSLLKRRTAVVFFPPDAQVDASAKCIICVTSTGLTVSLSRLLLVTIRSISGSELQWFFFSLLVQSWTIYLFLLNVNELLANSNSVEVNLMSVGLLNEAISVCSHSEERKSLFLKSSSSSSSSAYYCYYYLSSSFYCSSSFTT